MAHKDRLVAAGMTEQQIQYLSRLLPDNYDRPFTYALLGAAHVLFYPGVLDRKPYSLMELIMVSVQLSSRRLLKHIVR